MLRLRWLGSSQFARDRWLCFAEMHSQRPQRSKDRGDDNWMHAFFGNFAIVETSANPPRPESVGAFSHFASAQSDEQRTLIGCRRSTSARGTPSRACVRVLATAH